MRHDVSQALSGAMVLRNMDPEERAALIKQYGSAQSLAELPDWMLTPARPKANQKKEADSAVRLQRDGRS